MSPFVICLASGARYLTCAPLSSAALDGWTGEDRAVAVRPPREGEAEYLRELGQADRRRGPARKATPTPKELRGDAAELCARFGVHPTTLRRWRREAGILPRGGPTAEELEEVRGLLARASVAIGWPLREGRPVAGAWAAIGRAVGLPGVAVPTVLSAVWRGKKRLPPAWREKITTPPGATAPTPPASPPTTTIPGAAPSAPASPPVRTTP